MRITKTGTGRGQIVGSGRIDFHAQQDRAVRSAALSWEGDALFIPLLPGLGFDQYFPNLRYVPREDAPLLGKDAQQATLKEFEDWVAAAREQLDASGALPLFGRLPLSVAAPGEHITESAEFVVRFNDGKERLWGETTYASPKGRELLFHLIHELFWNYCAEQGHDAGAVMLKALEDQFDYYNVHGIPSDFLMRQIGRAPYAAWQAL